MRERSVSAVKTVKAAKAKRRSSPVRGRVIGVRGLSVIALAAVAAFAPWPPALVERVYSGTIYPAAQPLVTGFSGILPFALLDALIVAAAAMLVWGIVRAVGAPAGWRRWASLGAGAAAIAAGVYLAFLLLWGFNYQRIPLEARLDHDRSRVTAQSVKNAAQQAVEALNRLAPEARAARPGLSAQALRVSLAPAFAEAQRALGAADITAPARPKTTMLSFFFRWAGVDGMINPLGLEILINPDVLPVELPFVLAHEWGHLAGWAREHEASYVAWLTCQQGDPAAQYSAWLSLYLHLRRDLPEADRRALDARLGEIPRADMAAIAERLSHTRPAVRAASWMTYDRYLKANRAAEGVRSYDAIVSLVIGTATDANGRPRLR